MKGQKQNLLDGQDIDIDTFMMIDNNIEKLNDSSLYLNEIEIDKLISNDIDDDDFIRHNDDDDFIRHNDDDGELCRHYDDDNDDRVGEDKNDDDAGDRVSEDKDNTDDNKLDEDKQSS